MKINFRTILSVLIIINFEYSFAASQTKNTKNKITKTEVSDAILHSCYKKFPLLLHSLVLISDVDFADQKKSQERKLLITTLYEKNPSALQECVRSIVQRAEDEGDKDNIFLVKKRMKEFTSIVFQSQRKAAPNSQGAR